ncbi:hypothetical protein ATE48_07755 [Candidatus Viadribacter manganicus]|uniref:Uncharacterized protein n=1 Tax=Candidatus Viadribacter manganicus TaxID=1759059 RepID=A0A1B1AGY3_9PROT|nr:hypothetical protein ATE48_07755 [Candidatus Viadribacter manganicus]
MALAPSTPSFDLGYGMWIAAPGWSHLFGLSLVVWWAALAFAIESRTTRPIRHKLRVVLALAACAFANVTVMSFLIATLARQPILTALARVAVWSWIASVLATCWFTARAIVTLTTGNSDTGETLGVALLIFFAPIGVWFLRKSIAKVLAQPRALQIQRVRIEPGCVIRLIFATDLHAPNRTAI